MGVKKIKPCYTNESWCAVNKDSGELVLMFEETWDDIDYDRYCEIVGEDFTEQFDEVYELVEYLGKYYKKVGITIHDFGYYYKSKETTWKFDDIDLVLVKAEYMNGSPTMYRINTEVGSKIFKSMTEANRFIEDVTGCEVIIE